MRKPTLLALAGATAAVLSMAAPSSRAQLDPVAVARLADLSRSPESAGALIYRGAVFKQGATGPTPLFTYERRVGIGRHGLTPAHITRNRQGDVIIVEQARLGADYSIQRFDAHNLQLGYSGSVSVSADGRRLDYWLNDNGVVSTASEDIGDPVVAGPSLHGFILSRWSELVQGRTVQVRMIVMNRKQTYGFDIRRLVERDGRTSFTVTPSSLLLRLAMRPLIVSFDSATRHVVRYEGRVPPMQELNGSLHALDATVDYTMSVPDYL